MPEFVTSVPIAVVWVVLIMQEVLEIQAQETNRYRIVPVRDVGQPFMSSYTVSSLFICL